MKLSTLFSSIANETAQNTQNAVARAVYTSMLGSLVNELVNEYHNGDRSAKAQIIDDTEEKLKGLQSLELLEQLEILEQEAEAQAKGEIGSYNGYEPLTDVRMDRYQKFQTLKVMEVWAKKTAQIGNRFERPMTLADWLKFILGASSSNHQAREQLMDVVSAEFKINREDVKLLSDANIANERKRIDAAVKHIITEFASLGRQYPRVGDFDDLDIAFPDVNTGQESDVEIYQAYILMVKIINKMCVTIDKTVNNAVRFTNINMLTDARLLKGDIHHLVTLFQQAEADADDLLNQRQDFDIPMIDSRTLQRILGQ